MAKKRTTAEPSHFYLEMSRELNKKRTETQEPLIAPPGTIESYYLTNRVEVKQNRTCLMGAHLLMMRKAIVRIYDMQKKIAGFQACELLWCNQCNIAYMQDENFISLQRKIEEAHSDHYILPTNIECYLEEGKRIRFRYDNTIKQSYIDPSQPLLLTTERETFKDLVRKKAEIPVQEDYYVTDKIKSPVQRRCLHCSHQLLPKRFNIRGYFPNGNFKQFYIHELLWCEHCKKAFLTIEEFLRLRAQVERTGKGNYVTPKNLTRKYSARSQSYLYEPVIDEFIMYDAYTLNKLNREIDYTFTGINVATTQNKRNSGEGYFDGSILNESSFMSDLGYSVRQDVSDEERRVALNQALRIYPERKVVDYIRTQIGLKENHPNDYSDAIARWEEDLNYIANEWGRGGRR